MVFCPEHPKQDQNLNFTPLSETTSILASFIGEPPPPPPLPQPPRIQHCKKTLHSWTKENRFVIQIQKTFWRKLEPLFNRNKKLYASKEVKENALASEGKSCRPETKTTVNRYVCHDLSVWNKRLKSHFLSENVEPSGASTQQRKKTYWNKQHFGMR